MPNADDVRAWGQRWAWRSAGPLWAAPRLGCNLSSPPASSQCSVTCGKGYKQRLVSCSEIYTGKENYEYSYQTAVNCPGTQPPSVQPCYLRECPVSASWRVGSWASVSRHAGCRVWELALYMPTSPAFLKCAAFTSIPSGGPGADSCKWADRSQRWQCGWVLSTCHLHLEPGSATFQEKD